MSINFLLRNESSYMDGHEPIPIELRYFEQKTMTTGLDRTVKKRHLYIGDHYYFGDY